MTVQIYDKVEQAIHDLQSPLTALTVVSQSLAMTESQKAMIGRVRGRILGIVSNLRDANLERVTSICLRDLQMQVSLLLDEKQVEFPDYQFSFSGVVPESEYGRCVRFDVTEFARILSNLINNAVEAGGDKKKIEVDLFTYDSSFCLIVRDYGIGFNHDGANFFKRGFSTKGKRRGFGLSHARHTLEGFGGQILAKGLDEGAEFVVQIPVTSVELRAEVFGF